MVFHVPAGKTQAVFEGNNPVAISQYDQYIEYILDLDTTPSGQYVSNIPPSPFNSISEFIPGTYYQWNALQAFDIIT
jgi:hypothetical protein